MSQPPELTAAGSAADLDHSKAQAANVTVRAGRGGISTRHAVIVADNRLTLTGSQPDNSHRTPIQTGTRGLTLNFSGESPQSGGELTIISSGELDNSGGTISGARPLLSLTQRLTSSGLTDSEGLTYITTPELISTGGGRIYGGHIAIAATELQNVPWLAAEDSGTAGHSAPEKAGRGPVIAARRRLDLGVQQLTNGEHALIYSGGELATGGTLDTEYHASGQGKAIRNISAGIEAAGNITLNTALFINENAHFATALQQISQTPEDEAAVSGYPRWYPWGQRSTSYDEVTFLNTPDFPQPSDNRTDVNDNWYRRTYTRTIEETRITESAPALLSAGGDIRVSGAYGAGDTKALLAAPCKRHG